MRNPDQKYEVRGIFIVTLEQQKKIQMKSREIEIFQGNNSLFLASNLKNIATTNTHASEKYKIPEDSLQDSDDKMIIAFFFTSSGKKHSY